MTERSPNAGLLLGLDLFAWTAQELPIRFFGDASLRDICLPVERAEFGSDAIKDIADQLVATLTKYREHTGMGRGLAANQIGHNKRMVAVFFGEKMEIFYNPEILSTEGSGSYWESCLSSGTLIVGEVHRAWKATFRYFDLEGLEHTLEADEKQTRVLMHEIDHLDGITCDERYEPKTMKIVAGGKEEILGFPFKQIA